MSLKAKPLVRTNVALSGNVQMIVDADAYQISFAPLVDANSNYVEQASLGGTYADGALRLWKTLRYGINQIFDVKDSDCKTLEPSSYAKDVYDFTYVFGARQTKHANTYQFLAPLMLSKCGANPRYFVVFECDDVHEVSLSELIHKHGKMLCKFDLHKVTELQSHIANMSWAPAYVSQSPEQHNRIWGYSTRQVYTADSKNTLYDSRRMSKSGKLVSNDIKATYVEFDCGPVLAVEQDMGPIAFAKQMTSQFKNHECVCSQFVNLAFRFKASSPGIHRYVGLYVDMTETEEVDLSTDFSQLQNAKWYDDTINIIDYVTLTQNTAYVNDATATLPTVVDYTRLYKEEVIASFDENSGIRPNAFTAQRSVTFAFTGNMEPGEAFKVLVNGEVDLNIYCQHNSQYGTATGDADNYFIRRRTQAEMEVAFWQAFERSIVNTKYGYSYKRNDNGSYTIYINANSNFVDVELNVSPYSVSTLQPLTKQVLQWQSIIPFESAITTNNSIIVAKELVPYIQKTNYIVLKLPTGDVKTQIVRVADIKDIADVDAANENLIVVMLNRAIPDFVESIAFDLLVIKRASVSMCVMYDYHDFDAFWFDNDDCKARQYVQNGEWNLQAWTNWMKSATAAIASSNYIDKATNQTYQLDADGFTDKVKAAYDKLIDRHAALMQNANVAAIESIATIDASLKTTTNIFALSKDLQTFAKENEPNIAWSHWSAIDFDNSMNQPLQLNRSIAYNLFGFCPYAQIESYDVNAFAYSWFIEAFERPQYIETLPADKRAMLSKSYSVSTVTIDDLKDTVNDAYDKLVHIYVDDVKADVCEAYTTIYSIPNNPHAYANFKGVQWRLSTNFIGWRFCVMHMQTSDALSAKVEHVINNKFKTYTVVIKMQIVDESLTTLGGRLAAIDAQHKLDVSIVNDYAKLKIDANKLFVDKSMLYAQDNLQIVESDPHAGKQYINTDISFYTLVQSFASGTLTWPWSYDKSGKKTTLGNIGVYDDETFGTVFAIAINDKIGDSNQNMQMFTLGDDVILLSRVTRLRAGINGDDTYVVKLIKCSQCVNIIKGYLWFKNIEILQATGQKDVVEHYTVKQLLNALDEINAETDVETAQSIDDDIEAQVDKDFTKVFDATQSWNSDDIKHDVDKFYGLLVNKVRIQTVSEQSTCHLDFNMYVGKQRFSAMSYASLFATLQTDDSNVLQTSLMQTKVNDAIVGMSRSGQYAEPSLVNVTKFKALYDASNRRLIKNTMFAVNALDLADDSAMYMYARLNELSTKHNDANVVRLTSIHLLDTQKNLTFPAWNSDTASFKQKSIVNANWIETMMLANRCIALKHLAYTQEVTNASQVTVTIDLLQALTQLLQQSQIATSESIYDQANFLLTIIDAPIIKFVDAVTGQEAQPLTLDATQFGKVLATFNDGTGAIKCIITWS